MPFACQYITEEEFLKLLKNFNLYNEFDEDEGLDQEERDELIDAASSILEGELRERYVTPLSSISGAYELSPSGTRNIVKRAFRAALKIGLAEDHNINSDFSDSNENKNNYWASLRGYTKTLKDYKIDHGLKMHSHSEGATEPIQVMGIARSDNEIGYE